MPLNPARGGQIACLVAAAALCCGSISSAVTTSRWVQTTEAGFKEGTLHQLVATSSGDLQLSRAITMLVQQDPRFSLASAAAEAPDGSIYLGTGPSGLLLCWKDGKSQDVLSLGDGITISALAVDAKGNLLIGTGGVSGKLLRLEPGQAKPKVILQDPAVRYVWQVLPAKGGSVLVATGPEGNVYEVKADGAARVLSHTADANVLSLIAGRDDLLYAGTSPRGLVYRINRKTGESFVLYDAPESDITSLLLDSKGNLYAATGAETETGEGEPAISVGRPEAAPSDVPIHSEPPTNPKPPVLPNPTPGEPEPIPKQPRDLSAPAPLPLPDGVKHLTAGDDAEAEPSLGPATAPSRRAPKPLPRPPRPARPAPAAPPPVAQGNAVYRITPEGFVSEIFRQPALFYTLALQKDKLLIGSGSEGVVYEHDLATQETLAVARVESMDITSLLVARGGKVYLGLSNAGGLAEMTSGFAASGSFTSPVLDAVQVSRFGTMQLTGTLASDATLAVSFRSGNVEDADEPGWSKWSPEVPATEFVRVPCDAARFLQYRLSFASKSGQRSAVVDEVSVTYQMPNLPPVVKSVSAEREAAAPDSPVSGVGVSWEASDPNADTLRYALSYRMGRRAPWIELKKDLQATNFSWNTRTVADGRYQLRVVASDRLSNPEGGLTGTRLSDWLVVDNTPPAIGDVETKTAQGIVTCRLRVTDRTSTVAAVEFAVDSNDDWQAATASDKMFDSPDETASFQTGKLEPGAHQIAVRATDSAGNRAYTTLVVTVE